MQTQQDTKIRLVALTNLRAMCDHISGTCHTFEVTKVSRSRVHVEYSNPDEYGNEHPMIAVYPCFPSDYHGDEDNPRVLITLLRVIGDSWGGEGWQAFEQLRDCPTLWRGGSDGSGWRTHREIRNADEDRRMDLSDTCVICDLPAPTPTIGDPFSDVKV